MPTRAQEYERWVKANLPRGHNLPRPEVLAAQMAAMEAAVVTLLCTQRDRYVTYLREHPATLGPVESGALLDLPPEAALTHHGWLAGVVWAFANTERDEWTVLLAEHMREALGAGGMSGLRSLGVLGPGFATLTQKAAGKLLRQIATFEGSSDMGARALHRAVRDRARTRGIQGAVLRDGAGRIVAAATYRTIGPDLTVRYLGALDTWASGSGVQMVRELSGVAALGGKGMVLWASVESEAALSALGFRTQADGRFALSATSASQLAQTLPGPLPAGSRAGWLEGPEATLSAGTKDDLTVIRKEVAPLNVPGFGRGVAVLRDEAGALLAVAEYELPRAGGDLLLLRLWIDPTAPATTARQMMRSLATLADQHGRGMSATAALASVTPLLERMGMVKTAGAYGMSVARTASLASGLSGRATWVGQMSWELAVAGAREWLQRDVIPGIVDAVSETTHRRLVDTLVEGLARGEGTNDLIARIRAIDETTFGLARAERIARTEVLTANRAGAHRIAVAAGCTEHRWSSRLMPNTRDWHRDAHGQVRPINEPFVVSNRKGIPERLLFPGDRSLGAGPDNTIQCACDERTVKPGVNDPATMARYSSGPRGFDGPLVASMPESTHKAASTALDELRSFVATTERRTIAGRTR